jgi:hypothetical protein
MTEIKETIHRKDASPEKEEISELQKQRYLIQIELSSIRRYLTNDKDQKEYYFEVGDRSNRCRTPTRGYIHIGLDNDEIYPTSLTVYSRVVEGTEEDIIEIPMWIKEVNDELMKFDDTIAFRKLQYNLGSAQDVHKIKEGGTELEISIVSTKTSM